MLGNTYIEYKDTGKHIGMYIILRSKHLCYFLNIRKYFYLPDFTNYK